jgi:hypothetical protein
MKIYLISKDDQPISDCELDDFLDGVCVEDGSCRVSWIDDDDTLDSFSLCFGLG